MKRTLTALAIIVGFVVAANSQSWVPEIRDITKLEQAIRLEQLPHWDARLPALAGYDRYYTGVRQNGDRIILGEFVHPSISRKTAGFRIVPSRREFPEIFDGGCGIVNLVYSVREQKIVSIQCNGEA